MNKVLLAVALICPAAPLAAEDTQDLVVVHESLDPISGAVIGQHVALRVDVLFRDDMSHPPRVGLQDVPGLQVVRLESQATTLRQSIANHVYVGQRFEFALYARRGGAFEIAPASVTLLDRQGDTTGRTEGQPITLTVTVPPGVDASRPVVATRALTLDERWAPDPNAAFKPGDAIVRTITRTAEDVLGLGMRDLDFEAPDGVRAYVDPPEIDDETNRGIVTGRRIDRVTYVFERGGRVQFPSAAQPWWDLATGSLRSAKAAGTTVNIAVPPPNQVAPTVLSRVWLLAATAIAVLLIFLAGAFHFKRRRETAQERVEREAFAAVRRASAADDTHALYRAFAAWRLLLDPAAGRNAAKAVGKLEAALFAGRVSAWTTTDSRDLVVTLASLRKSRVHAAVLTPLPPLNPGGEIAVNRISYR